MGVRARLAQGLRGSGGQGHWLDVAKVRLPLCSAQHGQHDCCCNCHHQPDASQARHDAATVADVKQFMSVLYMFLPIPIFWALFDQQSSRWVFQAERMNGKIGSYEFKADQMQIFNSVFILILLPVFEKWVYPRMTRVKQLQRMALGMFLAALAFVVAGLLEMAIDRTGVDELSMMWQIPQYVFDVPNPTLLFCFA